MKNDVIAFDFSKNPEFNILNSFYYVNEMYEDNLPANRTYEGIWFELAGHYAFYKIDVFDVVENDNIAHMGNYSNDSNAKLWEIAIHAIIYSIKEITYDSY